MFEPATVAIHGVFQNDYHGGEYVAILGGGTVGMFTMQWTKIFGSKKVVVFDISDERLDLAKRLGADEVINTKEEGYMEKAMAITGGKGYGFRIRDSRAGSNHAYGLRTCCKQSSCMLYRYST